MRNDQISVVREAGWGPVYSSFRWSNAFAGLCVTLLVFSALAILFVGLSASSVNASLLQPSSFPKVSTAHRWILFWVFTSGAIAVFTGSFLAARSSGPITARVGRLEGLVIASLFLPAAMALCYLAGSVSPQYFSVADSVDPRYSNIITNLDGQSLISRRLQGLKLDGPEQRVADGLMRRIVRNDVRGANIYLSQRAGISLAEASRRLDPIRADVQNAFVVASANSAYLARLMSLLIFGACLLGSGAAMAGGTLGARMNQRAPLSERDLEAIEESAAA
jgi:hypothetical protein